MARMRHGNLIAVNPGWSVLMTDPGIEPANVLRSAGHRAVPAGHLVPRCGDQGDAARGVPCAPLMRQFAPKTTDSSGLGVALTASTATGQNPAQKAGLRLVERREEGFQPGTHLSGMCGFGDGRRLVLRVRRVACRADESAEVLPLVPPVWAGAEGGQPFAPVGFWCLSVWCAAVAGWPRGWRVLPSAAMRASGRSATWACWPLRPPGLASLFYLPLLPLPVHVRAGGSHGGSPSTCLRDR